jgi:hypothetical protein
VVLRESIEIIRQTIFSATPLQIVKAIHSGSHYITLRTSTKKEF